MCLVVVYASFMSNKVLDITNFTGIQHSSDQGLEHLDEAVEVKLRLVHSCH